MLWHSEQFRPKCLMRLFRVIKPIQSLMKWQNILLTLLWKELSFITVKLFRFQIQPHNNSNRRSNLNILKMKKLLCILTLLVLISCKNEKADSPDTTTDVSVETKENTSIFDSDLQLAIKNWNTYYKERQPGFELNNFYAVDSAKIERITGSVYGVFDNEFNTIYTDFLVFSEDG